MKPVLRQGLSQQLRLTPQLALAIRLLTLSRLELEAELSAAVESNPVLERDEDDGSAPSSEAPEAGPAEVSGTSPAEHAAEARGEPEVEAQASGEGFDVDVESYEDWGRGSDEGMGGGGGDGGELDGWESRAEAPASLYQHLSGQIEMLRLSPRERGIAEMLLALMEADGFLRDPPEALAEQMPPELHASTDEIEAVRHLLQSLDPVGVMSRDLGDSFCAQLRLLPERTEGRALAMRLARTELAQLARGDRARLAARLGVGADDLRVAMELLATLSPRPAAPYVDAPVEYLVPDVVVRREQGVWRVRLNPAGQPALRLNRHYARLATGRSPAQSYLREQLRDARWLLQSLKSRADTMLRVSECIVGEQSGFLDFGAEAMRPLTLREVAEQVGLSESTISRVTTRKYLSTPRGIFELKHFFSSSLGTTEGGTTSSHAIRALIRRLIENEDKTSPLSDQGLADELGRQGFRVARRTVAKYREAMNILPSSERTRAA